MFGPSGPSCYIHIVKLNSMNKKFIEKNKTEIKQLLIANGCVSENWEPGEVKCNTKWGGFSNDYFSISFSKKWIWSDKVKNSANIGGKLMYWSYDKNNLSFMPIEYLINLSNSNGVTEESVINHYVDIELEDMKMRLADQEHEYDNIK